MTEKACRESGERKRDASVSIGSNRNGKSISRSHFSTIQGGLANRDGRGRSERGEVLVDLFAARNALNPFDSLLDQNIAGLFELIHVFFGLVLPF